MLTDVIQLFKSDMQSTNYNSTTNLLQNIVNSCWKIDQIMSIFHMVKKKSFDATKTCISISDCVSKSDEIFGLQVLEKLLTTEKVWASTLTGLNQQIKQHVLLEVMCFKHLWLLRIMMTLTYLFKSF